LRLLFSTYLSGCRFLTNSSKLQKQNFIEMAGLTFYSNRRLDNKLNVFEGIGQNWFFIGINIITICGQVIIVSIGSSALSTVRLDMKQWAISLALGALSLPVAVLIRLIPDDFIRKLLPQSGGENQHLALDYEEASSEHLSSFE
jgi:Ca2+-transporting ATPase